MKVTQEDKDTLALVQELGADSFKFGLLAVAENSTEMGDGFKVLKVIFRVLSPRTFSPPTLA